MNERYTENDINKVIDRHIFFDANILMYLYGNSNSDKTIKSYSSIFSKLLKQKNTKVVDYIVISEFINRFLRIGYESHLAFYDIEKSSLSFKRFRNTEEGRDLEDDIYSIVKNDILTNFKITGTEFQKADILAFLHHSSLDFSDKALEKVCLENDYVFLTHDSDFIGSKLDILSSNRKFH